MKKYEMFELIFTGEKPAGSEVDVDLAGIFSLNGKETSVKGFYAGNGIYKIRFLPMESGECSWKIKSTIALQGRLEGTDVCGEAPSGMHGPVHTDGMHFRYADGTRYLPFGTTVYALLHQEKELIDQTMNTLEKAPFNKIRFCVFPKHYDFNHNEPAYFAFERSEEGWDYRHPCYPFWDALEESLIRLQKMGIEADLILFHGYDRWGFSEMSEEEALTYLDYAVRRLSAFPNLWWSLANEYEILVNFQPEWWYDFAEFIHENDSYGHLLSNHNFLKFWDFHQEAVTHCSIQDSYVIRVPELQAEYKKPVIFDECCYEGNIRHPWGNLSGFELVNRFWTACTMGGYCTHGETFMNKEEVLWWAKGGKLYGESPVRIAFLRSILEELPTELVYCESEMEQACRGETVNLPDAPGTEPFFKMVADVVNNVSQVRAQGHFDKERIIMGHCKEEAYLRYFARQCAGEAELELPEDGKYTIEVIDVWEMTRKIVRTDAFGKVTVNLPGKEGIALLARRH